MVLSSKRAPGAKGKLNSKAKVALPLPPADSDSSNSDSDQSQATTDAESDYDELTRKKIKGPKRRNKVDEGDAFSAALASILDQDTSATSAPIMTKNRVREQQLREEKLNYRARKALLEERRAILDKDRVVPTMQGFDHERKLRKTATRGVIKLFNVVKAQQSELDELDAVKTIESEKVSEMSKTKFLDLLKAKTS
ncbi:pre-60S ribosomal particles component [Coemansia sp. RSA 552]|nr:pre-60S ribosomal particles component [Coemansia sp. RSA 552]